MMFDQFLKKAAELLAKGERFVTASVVRFQGPISGEPGDKAIIFPDGQIWGWIGGGCAQPVVIKEALKALADDAVQMATANPGRFAGARGVLCVGAPADLIGFRWSRGSSTLAINSVIVQGKRWK